MSNPIQFNGTSSYAYCKVGIKYIDWRGQTIEKGFLLAGITTPTQVQDLLEAIYNVTNAEMTATVEFTYVMSGNKGGATGNVPNDDVNDAFELAFTAVDTTVTPNKTITKSVLIPAPLRAIEFADGTLNQAGGGTDSGFGVTFPALILNHLSSYLAYKRSDGSYGTGMTFVNEESHHISLPDIVDTK